MGKSTTIGGRRSHDYLRSPTVSSKLSTSHSSNRRPANFLNIATSSRNHLNHTKSHRSTLPTNLRHSKMSSATSRKRPVEEGLPFGPLTNTGIDQLLDLPPKKKICTEKSRAIQERYLQRRKVVTYAQSVQKKRALANSLNKSWARMPVYSQQGLRNPGVLCYRISLLQVLLHQPQFTNWLVDSHHPEHCVSDDAETCLACHLRVLILEYWRGVPRELSPVFQITDVLFRKLGWSAGADNGQADPDEQAAWIFKNLRQTIPSSLFSPIEAAMSLSTISSIRCTKCGYESRTHGHDDRVLPVPISPEIRNGTVSQYLHKYLVEEISGYRCEKCGDTSDKQRRNFVGHGPDVLAVQLKRFDWTGRKIRTKVEINSTLDLNRYRDQGNTDRLAYELKAVIKHSGNMGSGHYVCYAAGPDGKWHFFNDSSKTPSSLAVASSHGDFHPYLLFFQRKTI